MNNTVNRPPSGMIYRERIFLFCFAHSVNNSIYKAVRENMAPESTLRGKKAFDLGKWYDCVIKVSLYHGDRGIEDIEAVIDTGAYYSNISREVLYRLGCVEAIGMLQQSTLMNGVISTPTFEIDMSVRGLEGKVKDYFTEVPFQMEYPVLLGTRFLKLCNLYFFGKEGRFELVFG